MKSRMQRFVRALFWLLVFWPLVVVPMLVIYTSFELNGGCRLGPGRNGAARVQAARLEMYVDAFRQDCGRLPDSLGELLGVASEPDCVKSAPRESDLIDPFGTPFAYWHAADGSRFDVRSHGLDRVYGSTDDVTVDGLVGPVLTSWYQRVGWPRLIGALLLVLLAAAIVARALAAFGAVLRMAWRRWHTSSRRRSGGVNP
jgi:hypothetical protein